jgi:hypothetical protein
MPGPSNREQALAERLRPWSARAGALVARRLEDARAHAAGGRIAEAHGRIAELQGALAGPRGTGLIAEARAQFFRDAHGSPDREAEAVARTFEVLGRNAALQLSRLAALAAQDLTIVAAVPEPLRESALAAWEATHRRRLAGLAHQSLSDGQVALTEATARVHDLRSEGTR